MLNSRQQQRRAQVWAQVQQAMASRPHQGRRDGGLYLLPKHTIVLIGGGCEVKEVYLPLAGMELSHLESRD